jgi:uncharacterized damage-inducible protein DinB
MDNFSKEFIEQSIFRMEENNVRIEKCLAMLNEEEIWKKPNPSSNSVGNLILHLCGNIRQYIVSSLGKTEDSRMRDKEFSATGGFPKKELLGKILGTVEEANHTLKGLNGADLIARKSVQGYDLSGIGIIIHVVEHYSYHTAQIAFWTKLLKDKDLGFYTDQDLNIKNKP